MRVNIMPANSYQKAKKMLDSSTGGKIGLMGLRMMIMKNIGCDERTIKSYLKLMIQTKLIKDTGARHFEIK